MLKKIIFRVDGNANIGFGHLSRCIALFEILKKKFDCLFIVKNNSELPFFSKKYNLILIPSSIKIHEEPEWINQNFSFNEFIIIIDGYQFNSQYQKKLKKIGYSLVYIDDLAEEKIFADILINHSPNLRSTDFIKGLKNIKFALGFKYAILRPEFLKVSKKKKKLKKINEIFICFGGVDNLDLTNTALKGVLGIPAVEKINIIIGAFYNHKKIYKTIENKEKEIVIYKNIDENKMIDLMNKCQLAIVPSSTILYETCCVKMLVLSGYYVDNQIKIYKGFKLNKLIYGGGDLRKLNAKDFELKVKNIISDNPNNHLSYIKNQSYYFDGKQSKRIKKLVTSIC